MRLQTMEVLEVYVHLSTLALGLQEPNITFTIHAEDRDFISLLSDRGEIRALRPEEFLKEYLTYAEFKKVLNSRNP